MAGRKRNPCLGGATHRLGLEHGRFETGQAGEDRAGENWVSGNTKRWLIRGLGLAVLLAVGGFAVAASGIIPIKASSGHWAITAWFLKFSMSRSVATHTLGMKSPPLDDPRLVLKGAAHYESGCFPCHGGPSLRHPRIARAMTPHPPYLPETIPEWTSEELFYIVKHGVKFTGMPAWPAQHRDDEVWAMVAFLKVFPEMDSEQYQRLVSGEAASGGDTPPMEQMASPESPAPGPPVTGTAAGRPIPPAVAESCARCHGFDGNGRGEGAFPRLAGQRVTYLEETLAAYAQGNRHSGIMEPIAAGLDRSEIRQLSRYYGGVEAAAPRLGESPTAETSGRGDVAEQKAIERGEAIARQGIPDQKVPACVACHGPAEHPHNPHYPVLAGQYAEYLVLQLELFKKQHRGGSDYAHLMHPVAQHLTSQQMRDAALFYESLAAVREPVGDTTRQNPTGPSS